MNLFHSVTHPQTITKEKGKDGKDHRWPFNLG